MTISSIRGELPIRDQAPTPAVHRVQAQPAAESAFSQAMRGLGRQIDVGEAQVAAASRLRDYDTGTLIALQAGIYRYTEAVDIASKIVDRASNAVHTVLSSGR